MKKSLAIAAALTLTLTMGACSSNDDENGGTQNSGSASTSNSAAASSAPAEVPTAADLNAILAKAMDPATPAEEKAKTLENGEQAQDLLEKLSAAQQQSGAKFEVVDPVLPGYTPDSVLATVNYTLPDQDPRTIDNVEFLNIDGQWRLSQSWACTLAQNSLPAEEIPAYCANTGSANPPSAENQDNTANPPAGEGSEGTVGDGAANPPAGEEHPAA